MKKLYSLFIALLVSLALSGCSDSSSSMPASRSSLSSNSSSVSDEANAEDETIIYEDDVLKAVYLDIKEEYGLWTLQVKLENKTDAEITVLPMDSSVDDTMVMFTSGIPATIKGGKILNQVWLIGSEPTEKVEFSLKVCDKNMSELVQTEMLTINR